MSWQHGGVTREGKEMFLQRFFQRFFASAGEICPSQATGKDGIAAEKKTFASKVECQGVRGVAGHVKGLELEVADVERFAVSQLLSHLKVGDGDWQPEVSAGAIIHDDAPIAVGEGLDFGKKMGVANVVEMLVREQADPGRKTTRVEVGGQTLRRIDHEVPVGSLDQVTIGAERAVGKSVNFHLEWGEGRRRWAIAASI